MTQSLNAPTHTPHPPKQPVGPTEPVDKDTLLKFLESELTLFSQQRMNSGWTNWAFAGAMGALAWMLLGQWETGWPSSRLWALAYVTATLGFSYTLLIVQMLQVRNSVRGNKARFHLGSISRETSRAEHTFNIIQDTLLLWLIFWTPTSSNTRIWLGTWLGLALSMWLLLLSMSYTQFPFETGPSTSKSILRWAFPAHLILMTILVIPVYLLATDLFNHSPSGLDLKLGGLLAGLHFIAHHAINEGGRRPIMDNLLRVRRELALGGMTTQEAAKHIEIEFLGMRVSDVFQEAARDFLAKTEVLSRLCKSCVSSLDAVLATLSGGTNLSAQQRIDLINPVFESCSRQATEIYKSLTQLGADYKKTELKTRRLSSSSDAREAVTSILTELLSNYTAAQSAYNDINSKLGQLSSILKATPSSSSPPNASS